MRKPLKPDEKRSKIIGIKVKQETKEKIEYLSAREDQTISTFINEILEREIEKILQYAKIDWRKIPEEEKKK